MNFERVGSGRVVAIVACVMLTAATGGVIAQSNSVAVGLSLNPQPPETTRPWSADLNHILLLPQLREGSAESYLSANPRSGPASVVATNQSASAAVLQDPWYTIDEARMDTLMRRIEENGYGTSTFERDRSPLDRAVERAVTTVFLPEPIKIGHAQLGFSPYTAIKRKNPLCLLNPIPLALSW